MKRRHSLTDVDLTGAIERTFDCTDRHFQRTWLCTLTTRPHPSSMSPYDHELLRKNLATMGAQRNRPILRRATCMLEQQGRTLHDLSDESRISIQTIELIISSDPRKTPQLEPD